MSGIDVAPRVIVAGAGPSGMTAAIGLAGHGIRTTVVEPFGAVATRENLLNIAPAAIDELARLRAGHALESMRPVSEVRIDDRLTGRVRHSTYAQALEPDPTAARGQVQSLLANIDGSDERTWGRVRIADLENALRRVAAEDHGDLVDVRYGSRLVGIDPSPSGIRARIEGPDGSHELLDGGFLVSATGGRNPLGVSARPEGPTLHFVGGDFPRSDATRTELIRFIGGTEPRTRADAPYLTIGLHNDARGGHSLLWAQIGEDARNLDPEALRGLVLDRGASVGLQPRLVGERGPIPVNVQLGATDQAVHGRMLLVGDELQVPYFPNSTGANAGIISARNAADTIARALDAGDDATGRILRAHAERTAAANEALYSVNRSTLERASRLDPEATQGTLPTA